MTKAGDTEDLRPAVESPPAMPGLPGTQPDVAPVVAGVCLTLVYFVAGFVAYVFGQRNGRDRLSGAGRTLARLSPVPAVLGLVLAGLAALSGLLFLLGSVAAVLVALGVPVLSVTSALDEHAVD